MPPARSNAGSTRASCFERAYELRSPRPVVLINLAGVQACSGRLTEAAKNYRRILDDRGAPGWPPSGAPRARSRRRSRPASPVCDWRRRGWARRIPFQIDGQVVALSALEAGYSLDPGAHTLLVKHADSERARVPAFSRSANSTTSRCRFHAWRHRRRRRHQRLPGCRPRRSRRARARLRPTGSGGPRPRPWTAAIAIVATTTAPPS